MGPDLMRRPPKYVQGFIDRHGKPRFYLRRPGFKSVALPGLPWSPEFMAAYTEALAGQPLQPGNGRSARPGSLRALTISYFQSSDFRTMQPRTQRVYRNMIERFCEQQDKDGNRFGDKPAATLRREHIVRLMAAKADKPEAANMLRRVLRAMMKCAVDIGMRADNPRGTLGRCNLKRMASIAGLRRRSNNLKQGILPVRARDLHSLFFFIPGSAAPM